MWLAHDLHWPYEGPFEPNGDATDNRSARCGVTVKFALISNLIVTSSIQRPHSVTTAFTRHLHNVRDVLRRSKSCCSAFYTRSPCKVFSFFLKRAVQKPSSGIVFEHVQKNHRVLAITQRPYGVACYSTARTLAPRHFWTLWEHYETPVVLTALT